MGRHRFLQALGSRLPLPKVRKRGAQVALGHRPLQRHALTRIFLQRFAMGRHRFFQPPDSRLPLPKARKRGAPKARKRRAQVVLDHRRFCRDKAILMNRPEMTRSAHITIE